MEVPIFAKAYDLYKLLASYRSGIPKADRYTLWQRAEETSLSVIELLLFTSQSEKETKAALLAQASIKLNLLRILVRLARDTKAIDLRKYTQAQQIMDEIGRMLGGWIKSAKNADRRPPPKGVFKRKEKEVPDGARGDVVVGIRIQVLEVELVAIPVHVHPVAVGRLQEYLIPSVITAG